ncbi:MAG: 4Fe-4S cluster-binding domain-containing protein, partial [Thermodesulfovibrionia bacterium]|nr:4Fe-4S cluster-binding domain-containing protein [Thermodesulfovibrionia bacterium]
MQLSKYITIYSYKEKPDYLLFYSIKSAAKILLEKSILKSIEQDDLSTSDEETLAGLGFLVPDVNEEKKGILELFKDIDEKRPFNAIVVLNLDCNLACKYCFEGKLKGKHYMSSETANQLIDFAEKYYSRGNNIHIDFYGGEPLLSFNNIKYISGELKAAAEEKDLQYTSGLITNGTLLIKDRVNELMSYGLKDVKVTLDGLKDNHDIYRPF